MDLRTFLRVTEALLTELEDALKPSWVRSIRENLGYGEEGIALDQFVCALITDEIPVSPAQRDRIYELIDYFGPLSDETQRHYPYLMTASIDWLTIVDG